MILLEFRRNCKVVLTINFLLVFLIIQKFQFDGIIVGNVQFKKKKIYNYKEIISL